MRDDESQFVAELDLACGIFEQETSVFISGKFVGDTTDADRFRSEWTIRGKRLQSCIHDSFVARAMNNRCEDAQRRGEVLIHGAALPSDSPVIDIHEHV